VPSAEQINNRRKGRAEDRIPQTAQDRIGLLTFTVRNKALDNFACKTGGQPPPPHRRQQVIPSIGTDRCAFVLCDAFPTEGVS
jgi:hypothetical protein